MILDDISRKQLICYGHVERMDPTRIPKVMIHWKPEGRKKRTPPRRTLKDGIYTAMYERDLTLRLLMSYIYGAPILDVSRSHTTTQHSR